MLTLYGVHNSRAARIIWLCYELDVPFEQKKVIQAYRLAARPAGLPVLNTRSPEFVRINPAGLIPAIDDNGLVLTESLAITLYLAKKHGGPVAPATVEEEGQTLQWTLWAATEIERHALDLLFNRAYGPEENRDATVADNAEAILRDKLPVLDAALSKTGWLVGGRFTVADLNVAEIIRYASCAPRLFALNPNVKRWLDACHARPAFARMWQERAEERV